MNWFTAFVLYVLIWWTILFAVLPFGVRPQSDADDASGWRGAPAQPYMWRKLAATTLIAAILWGIAIAIIRSDYLSLRPA